MRRDEVEAIAFALPSVTRVIQWGASDVYKVGGKVFAICGDDSLSFKVTEIAFMVLSESGAGRQAPYCAKGQWIAVPLADTDPSDIADWLATAHSLIAAKLTKKARIELGLSCGSEAPGPSDGQQETNSRAARSASRGGSAT